VARNTATSQRITGPFGSGLAYPSTFYCRAQCPDVTTERSAFQLGHVSASDDNWTIEFRGDTGGDPVQFRVANGGGGVTRVVNSSGSFAASTWHDIVARATSTTDYDIFLDGVRSDGSTAAGIPSTTTRFVIGAFLSSGAYGSYLNDDICRCAAWSAALTDAEVLSLAAGFSPRRIRPQNIVFYAPLVREVQDIFRNGVVLTDTGTAYAEHPRTYGL